jgi:hypothetical protein
MVKGKSFRNQHSKYITKRIHKLRKSKKWGTKVMFKNRKEFVQDYSGSLFAKIINDNFTKAYVQSFQCPDCGDVAKERCHGVGEERPILVERALRRCKAKCNTPVVLKDIIIAFMEEHKTTQFTFKCTNCHKKETSVLLRKK